MATGNVLLMMPVAVIDRVLLHNSSYGLHIDRKSCGSRQYYNASCPFAHLQVAYELYFTVSFL